MVVVEVSGASADSAWSLLMPPFLIKLEIFINRIKRNETDEKRSVDGSLERYWQ